jgi:hypothetical protein
MPTVSPNSSPSFTSWGVVLAASSVLMIGAGAVMWTHEPPPPAPMPDGLTAGPLMISKAISPLEAPDAGVGVAFHSVSYTSENGTRVVKIRLSATGDELIVDAATGRLIEARPARPIKAGTAPVPLT